MLCVMISHDQEFVSEDFFRLSNCCPWTHMSRASHSRTHTIVITLLATLQKMVQVSSCTCTHRQNMLHLRTHLSVTALLVTLKK